MAIKEEVEHFDHSCLASWIRFSLVVGEVIKRKIPLDSFALWVNPMTFHHLCMNYLVYLHSYYPGSVRFIMDAQYAPITVVLFLEAEI